MKNERKVRYFMGWFEQQIGAYPRCPFCGKENTWRAEQSCAHLRSIWVNEADQPFTTNVPPTGELAIVEIKGTPPSGIWVLAEFWKNEHTDFLEEEDDHE